MRKLVVILVAVAAVAVAAPRLAGMYDRWRTVDTARDRVEQLLTAMHDSGTSPDAPEARTAACLWFKGTPTIVDRDELVAAQRGFAAWRAKRRLGGPVRSWRIESAALPDPEDRTTVMVMATVNGQTLSLTVQRGQPIS
jgi:hypothetical protein